MISPFDGFTWHVQLLRFLLLYRLVSKTNFLGKRVSWDIGIKLTQLIKIAYAYLCYSSSVLRISNGTYPGNIISASFGISY